LPKPPPKAVVVYYFTVIEGPWEFNEQLEKDSEKYLQPWEEKSDE